LPPLLGSSRDLETLRPLGLLVPETDEEPFSPLEDVKLLPESRIDENNPLIGGAEELGKAGNRSQEEGNPARQREARSGFSELLAGEGSPDPQSPTAISGMPYPHSAQQQMAARRLPQTEKTLKNVKKSLFGTAAISSRPDRKRDLWFRPTADFRPSAFSPPRHHEPTAGRDFLDLQRTPATQSAADLGTFGSHSFNSSATRLLIPGSLASTTPAVDPGTRSAAPRSLTTPARVSPVQGYRARRSGAPLIDKFLDLSEPEF